MAPKASITVQGVSLTLVDVTDTGFSVALIPHTLAETTLGELQLGDWLTVGFTSSHSSTLPWRQQTNTHIGRLNAEKKQTTTSTDIPNLTQI